MSAEPPPSPAPRDWMPARPEKVTAPSIRPAVVGLGIAFLFWGLISSLILSGVGAVLFVLGLGGWIQELRHERKT